MWPRGRASSARKAVAPAIGGTRLEAVLLEIGGAGGDPFRLARQRDRRDVVGVADLASRHRCRWRRCRSRRAHWLIVAEGQRGSGFHAQYVAAAGVLGRADQAELRSSARRTIACCAGVERCDQRREVIEHRIVRIDEVDRDA